MDNIDIINSPNDYYDDEEYPVLGTSSDDSEPIFGVAKENNVVIPDIELDDKYFKTIFEIINLPKNISFNIQKTYFGDKYIYFLQNENESKKSHISRIPYKSDIKTYDATNAETMLLNDFGHSQALEYFEYNGGSYFWTGCAGADSGKHRWAKCIGLIKFNPKSTPSLSTSNVKRLQKLECANKLGKSYGTLIRAEVALSPNRKNLLIMARCKVKDPDDYVTSYAIYDANSIAKLLFEKKSTLTIYCDNDDVIKACKSSFVCKDSAINSVLYTMSRCSNTGLEIDDNGNIYYSSDCTKKVIDEKTKKVTKIRVGKFIFKVSSVGKPLKTIYFVGEQYKNKNSEMEGLQFSNSKLYFTDIYYREEYGKKITGIKEIYYKM